MAPDGEHDLGPIFLRAFFACLIDRTDLNFDGVTLRSQVQTEDRKFIDLLVSGPNWVLLIENKIDAPIDNPLESYKKQAKRYFPGREELYLAILSPYGIKDPDFPQWKAVSYQKYCTALKSEFTKTVFDHPISKWQVFAREFIIHIENTLDNPAMKMKPEQTAFVEANLREIRVLKKLSDCHTADLLRELSERLQKELLAPGRFYLYEENNWAFYCKEKIGQLQLEFVFHTPLHEPSSDTGRDFFIAAWVKNLTEEQLNNLTEEQRQRLDKLLFTKGGDIEQGGQWIGKLRCSDRSTAVNELCKLAKELFDLWGNEPPSAPA
jgi:hypothetical protein